MWPVSSRFTETAHAGGRLDTVVTATPPGDEPVVLTATVCQVSKALGPGVRFDAKLTVVADPGAYEALRTPGTLIDIRHGFQYGHDNRELIPLGRYEVAKRPRRAWDGLVDLDLMDLWRRLEEARFLAPRTVGALTTRRQAIIDAVLDAIPGQRIVDGPAVGGTLGTAATFDRDRVQMITDLANDGSLDAGFAADGAFLVQGLPVIGSPVATFSEREGASVGWVSDEATYERLYNAVVVSSAPAAGGAARFSPQTMRIGNPDHPRHPSKIGVRPYFYSSPTLATAPEARRVAAEMLWRVTQDSTRVSVSTMAAPQIEPGDTITVVPPGEIGQLYLVEKVAYDCLTAATTIEGRSLSDLPLQEEAA